MATYTWSGLVGTATEIGQSSSGKDKTWFLSSAARNEIKANIPDYSYIKSISIKWDWRTGIWGTKGDCYVYFNGNTYGNIAQTDNSWITVERVIDESTAKASFYSRGKGAGLPSGDFGFIFKSGIYRNNWIRNVYITYTYELPRVTINTFSGEGGKAWTFGPDGLPRSSITVGAPLNPWPYAIEAEALEGYRFVKWNDGNTERSRNIQIPITAYEQTVNYTATFELVSYSVTTSANPIEGGTVTGGGTYNYNSTATLTASPNTGYKFIQWLDGVESASRTVTVIANATYTAIFEPVYVTFDTILSFKKWRNKGITSDSGVISNISDIGFTITSNSGTNEGTTSSPYFSVEPGASYKIDIDIEGDNWDVYFFFCDASGEWVGFSDTTNKFSSDGGGNPSRIFTAPDDASVVKAQIRVDANGSSNTVSFSNFRVYPADHEYMSETVAAEERSNSAFWDIPAPSRSNHSFLNWNTKPDGNGIIYTSASTFPTDDLTLYSQWGSDKISKIYIGASQPSAIYIGTTPVKEIYIGTTKIYG